MSICSAQCHCRYVLHSVNVGMFCTVSLSVCSAQCVTVALSNIRNFGSADKKVNIAMTSSVIMTEETSDERQEY
jgi:hypothetical protein